MKQTIFRKGTLNRYQSGGKLHILFLPNLLKRQAELKNGISRLKTSYIKLGVRSSVSFNSTWKENLAATENKKCAFLVGYSTVLRSQENMFFSNVEISIPQSQQPVAQLVSICLNSFESHENYYLLKENVTENITQPLFGNPNGVESLLDLNQPIRLITKCNYL